MQTVFEKRNPRFRGGFFIHTFVIMQESLPHLITALGTGLIGLLIGWIKKRMDIKALKSGKKTLDNV